MNELVMTEMATQFSRNSLVYSESYNSKTSIDWEASILEASSCTNGKQHFWQ